MSDLTLAAWRRLVKRPTLRAHHVNQSFGQL